MSECMDPANEGLYVASAMRCWASVARDAKADQFTAQGTSSGVHYTTRLRREGR